MDSFIAVLTTLPKKILTRDRFFFDHCPKLLKLFRSYRNCFPPNFLMDTYAAVLTHLLKFFARRPKIFRPMSQKEVEKLFHWNKFLSKCYYRQLECSFDHPSESFSTIGGKLYAHWLILIGTRSMKRSESFSKKKFTPKIPMER